jgi:hypothetical protein
MRNLLKLDLMSVAARTLEILYDPQRKKLLLVDLADAAQSRLDHLQSVMIIWSNIRATFVDTDILLVSFLICRKLESKSARRYSAQSRY